MTCKSLLTVVTRATALHRQLDAAIALARSHDAHLDILCLTLDRAMAGYYYVGAAPLAPIVLQETVNRAREDALALEAGVRERMSGEEIRWAVETAVAPVDSVIGQVGHVARFADMVVLPKPFGKDAAPDEDLVVEAALFEAGAPALLLPDDVHGANFGKVITIGWNDSRQSLNAVRAAMPFLKAANRVDVAIVEPDPRGPERSDPGGLLSQYLARHGVRAELSVLARTEPRVSETLVRHAVEKGSDMMVMGAYGHSRFREAILGGATRELFEIAPLPLFAVH